MNVFDMTPEQWNAYLDKFRAKYIPPEVIITNHFWICCEPSPLKYNGIVHYLRSYKQIKAEECEFLELIEVYETRDFNEKEHKIYKGRYNVYMDPNLDETTQQRYRNR